jgi:microcystin-dependent protein
MKSSQILVGGAWLVAVAVLVLWPAVAPAQATRLVPYDGYLEQDGAPADGPFDMVFRIYDGGGTALWAEEYSESGDGPAVQVVAGRFFVMLGEHVPLAGTLWSANELYLEVEVEGVPLSVRQRLAAGAAAVDGEPAGVIMLFAGSVPPAGWLSCDGRAMSRTSYARLFAAIGTAYGAGDGSTTFNLPDFRGMFPRGTGTHGSRAKAAGGNYAGPALGAYQDDSMQGHRHGDLYDGSFELTSGSNWGSGSANIEPGANFGSSKIGNPTTDTTNGTPRVGNETRPASLGVNFIIRY